MRPAPVLLFRQRALVLLTALLVFSAFLSTVAISRSHNQPIFLTSQSPTQQQKPQEQQQQQQQPPDQPPPQHPLSSPSTNPSPPSPSQPPTTTLPPEYKYFHEPGGTYALQHYDKRFFRHTIPYTEHHAVLQQLIRSYLTTLSSLHLSTWLAHGTLLGWWWNGRIMPWDWDLDVQLTGETLGDLVARGWNGSFFEWKYTVENGDGNGGREEKKKVYYLDVNPFWDRVDRGQGQNVIDARWIDVDNGMFVDITALVERDPEGKKGVVSCKNFHEYREGMLFPLRESEFEGVRALVPDGYEKVLVEEYGKKSLVVTEWEGHRWDPGRREWVKMNETETEEVL